MKVKCTECRFVTLKDTPYRFNFTITTEGYGQSGLSLDCTSPNTYTVGKEYWLQIVEIPKQKAKP